jgi:stage II sporulation protein D
MITIKKEPIISVGILSEKKISFDLYGEFNVEGLNKILSGRFSAELIKDKIICKRGDEIFEFSNEVIFEPVDPSIESFLIKDVIIGLNFHWERREKERFAGTLKIIKDNGKLTALNIISIEGYLSSVISSEMNAKSSLQLLKAHAIVSRSWLLSQLQRSKYLKKEKTKSINEFVSENEIIRWYDKEDHKYFDVCADDHCQRYQGITKIISDVAIQAIEQTKGIVLTYDNTLCDARYSKSCGGITESFHNVWEPIKIPYLTTVVDYKYEQENFDLNFDSEINASKWIKGNVPSFCNLTDKKIISQVLNDFDQETKDFFRWKVEYTQEELGELINSKTQMDFGNIIDLIPIERGNSARIIKLKIKGTKKELTFGKELEIRRILSKTHLYSSAFIVGKVNIVNEVPQNFIFYGAGWGHGVGLCQIGAAYMASKGYQFDEILFHYFTGTKLKKLY